MHLAARNDREYLPMESKKNADAPPLHLKLLIEAKAKGQKRRPPPPKAAKSNVIDLVAALQESLGTVKKGKKRTAA